MNREPFEVVQGTLVPDDRCECGYNPVVWGIYLPGAPLYLCAGCVARLSASMREISKPKETNDAD